MCCHEAGVQGSRPGQNPGSGSRSPFKYFKGELFVEEVAVKTIARHVGTPVYIYSATCIASNYRSYSDSFANLDCRVFYSIKANSNIGVLRHLSTLGAGFDAVSGGEIRRALAVGAPAGSIVFSGVGKTRNEMALALEVGIRHINVESEQELLRLSRLAGNMGKVASVLIRVNPDVDANTHTKIATGRAEDKFGIPWSRVKSAYVLAEELPNLNPIGLAMHIGSQLMSLEPISKAADQLAGLVRSLRAEGHQLDCLDVGGGLGVQYRAEGPAGPSVTDYARLVQARLGDLDCELELEPGRSIVADAGILAASVLLRKRGISQEILVLDAAMNDLVRPALYGAWHEIVPVQKRPEHTECVRTDVVGPICESGDRFASGLRLPRLDEGELVAVKTAGAYCAVMASQYNSRPLVPEVFVRGQQWTVVRRRPSFEEIIGIEAIPDWL